MEDHLLEIFGGHDTKKFSPYDNDTNGEGIEQSGISWTPESLKELSEIPGFVRGKVKRNTEKFAKAQEINEITLEVMYKAKEAVAIN